MNLFTRIFHLGVRDDDDFFDKKLKIAVNILSINAIVSIFLVSVIDYLIQHYPSSLFILFSIPVFLFVIYLNTINKSLGAITILFVASALLLSIYSIRLGEESYTHIHFVLNIIGVALLFHKVKAKKYLFVNLIFTLLCLGVVMTSFRMGWFVEYEDHRIDALFQRKLNFYLLISMAFVFSMVVVNSYALHNRVLQTSVEEQKVLLAEVNHRVKNNMAVIISLLNLKKHTGVLPETEKALNEVRDRVLSMALVHQQIYEYKSKSAIEMEKYVNDLLKEVKNSYFHDPEVSMVVEVENVQVNASLAIPIGLILNELITNSMKHAFLEVAAPEIKVICKRNEIGGIVITVRDNGNGFYSLGKTENGKLGMTLIDSLCEQLDGVYSFENDKGLVFNLVIPQEKI